MRKHCVRVIFIVVAILAVHVPARADKDAYAVEVDADKLTTQAQLDDSACGSVSIVNALSLGDAACRKALAVIDGKSGVDKAQAIIDTFGGKSSADYNEGKRIRPDGISCEDLTDMAGEIVAKHGLKARGRFLDRRKNESDRAFLKRIHRALAKALHDKRPPIVSVRSFATRPDAKFDDGYSWNGVAGHYVVITRVPAKLADHEWGFAFDYVDPASGRVETGYVHLERQRPFVAAKGNNTEYEWLNGRPFLLVTAPSLPLGTNNSPWFARTIVTLNFAITLAKK